MTTKAYVLIETAVGESENVSKALRLLPGVDAVDTVTGPYDIIAVVSANDLNAVGQIVNPRGAYCRGNRPDGDVHGSGAADRLGGPHSGPVRVYCQNFTGGAPRCALTPFNRN